MTNNTTLSQEYQRQLAVAGHFSFLLFFLLFFSIQKINSQVICPTIGAIDVPIEACEGFPFNLTATGLEDFDAAENNETNFEVRFVYLPAGSVDDPYLDGIELGQVIPDNGIAELQEVGAQLAVGNYDVYALLSPDPADGACRPFAMATIGIILCDDLGDFTFIDFDNNGSFDGDDVPLPQVLARIYDADADTESLTMGPLTSNVDGNYWYTAVPPANYFFLYEPPAGYLASGTVVSGDNGNKIDAAAGNGATSTADFTFAGTALDYTFDAGFIGPGMISGTVWPDDDFGLDFDEAGTDGVAFELSWHGVDGVWDNADDVTLQKSSAAGGVFAFPNLPYGEYRLSLTSVTGTVLAEGYDLVSPANNSFEFIINGGNTSFANNNFIYQPQCLPSPGRLTTTDELVMCGNATLGIYADQEITVRLNDFVSPLSIADDYTYMVVVVNEDDEIIQVHPIANPVNNATVVVDLEGLPIGDYGIHGLHYLATDLDLIVPFDFAIGADFNSIVDQLSLVDGNVNPSSGLVCGDVSLSVNNLTASMNPQPPVYLGCLGAVNVSLNQECGATVTPPMVLVGDWGCLIPSDFQVSIFQDGVLVSEDGTLSGCGTYEYFVEVLVDGISGFPCWGYVVARDVTAPVVTCPPNVTGGASPEGITDFLCDDIDQVVLNTPVAYIVDGDGQIVDIDPAVAAILDQTGYPVLDDGCDFVRIYVSDQVVENGDCGLTTINRTFFAEDKFDSACQGSPNLSNICTQVITFRNPNLGEIILPPGVVELDCAVFGGGANPSPEQISEALGVLGFPAVLSFFDADPSTPEIDPHLLDQTHCNLGASFEDRPRIELCGNTYTFIREWYIVDKCDLSMITEFNQLIKVKDYTDPTLVLPTVDYNNDGFPDVRRFSTAPYACEANITIPAPTELYDFCSGPPSLEVTVRDMAGTFLFLGTSGQVFTVPPGSYELEYCATDECNNEICETMPIIVRDEIAPSVICDDELNVQIGGGDILSGLYGIARVFATSVDEGSVDNCSANLELEVRRNYWNNNDCGLSSNQYSPWGDFVDFYCCDINREVTLELRVTDEVGNSNECWLVVTPEDKLRPFCYSPAPQTLSCAELPLLYEGDIEDDYNDNFAATSQLMSDLFGGPTGTDNCAVDTVVERTPMININACGWGTLTRRFEAWQLKPEGDLNGNGAIDVNEVLRSTNACNQLITITETHQYVIDFPADAEADCLDPEVPGLITETSGCDNLVINEGEPQRFSATGDECYKLSITYDVINWCIWDGEADAFVVARQTDTDNTDVDACERPVVRVNDSGAIIDRNHPEPGCDSSLPNSTPVPSVQNVGRWAYTQFIKVYDSSLPTFEVAAYGGPTMDCPDLLPGEFPSLNNETCESEVSFAITLDDACEVFDNTGNLVLSIPTATVDWFAVDANDDGQIDVTEFGVEEDVTAQVVNNGDATFSITFDAPVIYQSEGTNVYHTLRLEAVDGCGNPAVQYISFKVIDCNAPTPICLNGLTATLSPNDEGTCDASIWVSDFLGSPITDCSEPIGYAIYRAADVQAAGPDFVPSPLDTGLVLTLDDEETTVLYIYAIDSEGNYGFCETYILVQPGFACLAFGAIGGMIATEELEPVGNVQLSLSGPMPLTTMSEPNGSYLFDNLEEDFDYTVTAYRNDDPLNGVTTFDIVLISKHILALDPLDSPYKRIAADVNRSGSITTLDIIQLRKLILNIYTEFPSNTSWRFIDQDYVFPQPDNPWVESFPELINLNDLIGEELSVGFTGVKIGDVNGSADGSF
ncbi:SdrD B-like domain-containing protein [Lewinella cohaerens]|uniref:SdrD B-like domain-containing protein n=1 Tax=Lewinella cohaerens TaxID=70995 RepID=UPI00037ED1F7|nr:SdrD B-like domain-containing protein [Lewinella cohaerens]